jgi:hypothetical protein
VRLLFDVSGEFIGSKRNEKMNDASGEKPNVDNKNAAIPTKICAKCRQSKPVTEFHQNRSHKSGLQSWCKFCREALSHTPERERYEKQYYADNKTEILAKIKVWSDAHRDRISQRGRVYHYKTYFNLTLDELQIIVDYQRGCCAMCGRPLPKPHLDHSHEDGLIRGALCWPCNRLLGLAHDNPERLQQGINYLADPPATRALGAPRYGLVGRVGTKKQRKLAKKLAKQKQIS